MTGLFTKLLADGAGTPVVVSHALGLDHSMWETSAAKWHGERPVLAYDHRGHGKSAVPQGSLTIDDLVNDAEAVLAQWNRGPVIWIGLSLGGMVGQGLAIRRPDLVRGLVLAHTTARYPEPVRSAWDQRICLVRDSGMQAVVDAVMQRYLADPIRLQRPALAAALRERFLATDPKGYAACCRAIRDVDWQDQLDRISAPTLVIAGELDIGAPPAMSEDIHRRIPGSRLTVIRGVAHLSPLESPADFDACVREFIEHL